MQLFITGMHRAANDREHDTYSIKDISTFPAHLTGAQPTAWQVFEMTG